MAPSPTRVLLVRHGQSTWNELGRWQGWADPVLSELGRRQAEAAIERVGAADAVVSSDLIRARQTAEIMAVGLGLDAGAVTVEAGLRERSVGQWAGLTTPEIEARWPGMITAVAQGESPPGGESLSEFVPRVIEGIERIAVRHPAQVVVAVAHGGVIRNLERHLGVDPRPCPNLAGVWVTVTGEHLAVGDRVLLADPDDVRVSAAGRL